MNIYVAYLPDNIDDLELRNMFLPFGRVESSKVIIDRDTGRSKGFGFVEMPESDGQKAIDGLQNWKKEDGRKVTVNVAKEKEVKKNHNEYSNSRW